MANPAQSPPSIYMGTPDHQMTRPSLQKKQIHHVVVAVGIYLQVQYTQEVVSTVVAGTPVQYYCTPVLLILLYVTINTVRWTLCLSI